MSMTWTRNGRGGYAGRDIDRDANGVVCKSASARNPGWVSIVTVCGREVARRHFRLVADAKWFASDAAQNACLTGGELTEDEIERIFQSTIATGADGAQRKC